MRGHNNSATRDGSEDAAGSDKTLESDQNREGIEGDERKPTDDGEKGGENGPSPPVGFWSPALSKTRRQVYGLWLRTSKKRFGHCSQELALTLSSSYSFHLHLGRSLTLLGSVVPCRAKPQLLDCLRCGL